jgi:hypothetical protein
MPDKKNDIEDLTPIVITLTLPMPEGGDNAPE